MKKGIIYALYYEDKPFYIGQTKRTLWIRYKEHRKETFAGKSLLLYDYLRTIVFDYDDFQSLIHIKKIAEADIDKLDDLEVEYIRLCSENNIRIYNKLYNKNKNDEV